jgi:hypothetical protein
MTQTACVPIKAEASWLRKTLPVEETTTYTLNDLKFGSGLIIAGAFCLGVITQYLIYKGFVSTDIAPKLSKQLFDINTQLAHLDLYVQMYGDDGKFTLKAIARKQGCMPQLKNIYTLGLKEYINQNYHYLEHQYREPE